MSRVSTRNTCSSDFGENAAHFAKKNPQFFWGGRYGFAHFLFRGFTHCGFSASLEELSGCFSCLGRPAVFQQGADGVYQRGAARAQLADTVRATCSSSFTARKKSHQYAPAVVPAAASGARSHVSQPVDQLHGAVDAQCQPVRQRTNRRFLASGVREAPARADTVAARVRRPPPRLLRRRICEMR